MRVLLATYPKYYSQVGITPERDEMNTLLSDEFNATSRKLFDARNYRDLLKALLKRAQQEQASDWLKALPEAIGQSRNTVKRLAAMNYNLSRRLARRRGQNAHSR